jgi:general secretion pathway protein H
MNVKTTKLTAYLPPDLTENPELPTTSKATNFSSAGKPKGFTLVEILIVLAIIAMMVTLGLPAIERVTYQRLNSTTRKFSGLIHTIRNDAILLNNIYRLAIDFDRKAYWVESQREFKLLGQEEVEAQQSRKKKKKEDETPSNFMFAEKYNTKPTPLPGGIAFTGVLKEREGLIAKGIAYIHFFPNGFNEQAILYLNKEGASASSKGYSVILRPTAGKVEIFAGQVPSFVPPVVQQ